MNGSNSYDERNSCVNIAEVRFEEYCKQRNLFMQRLGFDEKNNPVPNFFNLNSFIRNLPDYFICDLRAHNQPCALVMVKGTANIKKSEYELINDYIRLYSAPRCKLIYAFCFQDSKPLFMKPDEVMKRYELANDRVWSDQKIYRNLSMTDAIKGIIKGGNEYLCQANSLATE